MFPLVEFNEEKIDFYFDFYFYVYHVVVAIVVVFFIHTVYKQYYPEKKKP